MTHGDGIKGCRLDENVRCVIRDGGQGTTFDTSQGHGLLGVGNDQFRTIEFDLNGILTDG